MGDTSIPTLSCARDFFPFETIRGPQEEMLLDMEKVFGEKKILLAQAPTGLGKTACALAGALCEARKSGKKVFFLTNRHTQHRIAIETLKLIKQKINAEVVVADLVGKRHMCLQSVADLFASDFGEYCKVVVEKGECAFYSKCRSSKKVLTAEAKIALRELIVRSPLHIEEMMNVSREHEMCGYELGVELSAKAEVIVCDYNYIFSDPIRNGLFSRMEIALEDVILIVDEAHNLPTRVQDMLSSQLTTFMLKNAIMEAKKFGYGGVIEWLSTIVRIMTDLSIFEGREKEKIVTRDQFMLLVQKNVAFDTLVDELLRAADEIRKKQKKSALGGIASFLEAWQGPDVGYVRILEEKETRFGPLAVLSYTCLDASIATRGIFDRIHAGVLMSGTLTPTFMYKDVLGISRGVEKEYLSPFPPENKLSMVIPETSTKYSGRSDEMFVKIALKCSELESCIPGNVAFFFPSYNLRDKVLSLFVSFKKIFVEKSEMTKADKEIFIAEFRNASLESGGVLMGVAGANFAEGVDFPGDLLKAVVVVGLPLSRPDLHTKALIDYYQGKFGKGWEYGYTYPAMSKCVQSAGRCIRLESDRGAVIYLDERFSWPQYYSCLPREGLRVVRDPLKLLKEFFI